ncbi:unnamed protein product [Protopolystoma xenopodis]|uniref:Ubiquinone biosynthesis protein COQ7 n=1 Tax=Protopolystoma xenopodis TaxID=117903 RepID=A0A3S5CKB8_9PLAT|nr:unnamed protein product [Protopolystoma xenopodis]
MASKLAPRTRALLDKIIRVDHAGEIGANRIYQGQLAILGKTPDGPTISQMCDQEKVHLATFEELIPKYRVRPTLLRPLWDVCGFALGMGTALLGREAAMACTVAVESVIGDHYNDQIRELMAEDPEQYKALIEVNCVIGNSFRTCDMLVFFGLGFSAQSGSKPYDKSKSN